MRYQLKWSSTFLLFTLAIGWSLSNVVPHASGEQAASEAGFSKGLFVVLGMPDANRPESVLDIAAGNESTGCRVGGQRRASLEETLR